MGKHVPDERRCHNRPNVVPVFCNAQRVPCSNDLEHTCQGLGIWIHKCPNHDDVILFLHTQDLGAIGHINDLWAFLAGEWIFVDGFHGRTSRVCPPSGACQQSSSTNPSPLRP